MTVAIAPISAGPTVVKDRQRILLRNISWETYRLLRQECDQDHLKMTFDRGALEIMAPRADHAIITRFIDQMISILCDVRGIAVSGYRDTTWYREAIDRGLEADDAYYIQHVDVADSRGANINLNEDPPPDLAVETDITHSTIDKEAMYAALGVPELWRWENGTLRIRHRTQAGIYQDLSHSVAFPVLSAEIITDFVRQRIRDGESKTKNAFRQRLISQ